MRHRLSWVMGKAMNLGAAMLTGMLALGWGMDGLLGLVRANGRFGQAIGISTTEFEQRWHAWLRSKYLS